MIERSYAEGITENSVRAPFVRFLLITNGKQCLALQFLEHIDLQIPHVNLEVKGQLRSRYLWLVQDDGSLDFSNPNVQQGEGKLSVDKEGVWQGGRTIKQGAFNLTWHPRAYESDWIYFPYHQKHYQFAVTEWIRPEDIGKGGKIQWRSAR